MIPQLEASDSFHDLHNALIMEIRRYLVPILPKHYRAKTSSYTALDEAEMRVQIIPDVTIRTHLRDPQTVYTSTVAESDEPTFTLSPVVEVLREIYTLQIEHGESGALVTSVEILSPVNKREPGFATFKEKQRKALRAGVNLVEIDLLRRGKRRFQDDRVTETDYLVAVIRAQRPNVDVWAFSDQEPLPIFLLPLLPADAELDIPLNRIFRETVMAHGFDRQLHYRTKNDE